MKSKSLVCLFFLLFHMSVIVIAYDFLFTFAKINHFGTVFSGFTSIPLIIWGIIIIELVVTAVQYFNEKKNNK